MKLSKKTLFFILIAFFFISPPYLIQAGDAASKDSGRTGAAQVTFLKGDAYTVDDISGVRLKSLSTGDLVSMGDTIRTGKGARVEIKLPDKSFIRFDELTLFHMKTIMIDNAAAERKIDLNLDFGKVWARVSKFFTGRGRFAISTRTAIAGVRGTVYRMNVNKDDSAVVKVYQGVVEVKSKPKSESITKAFKSLKKPNSVPGPHPIAGPHPVTMKEWVRLVSAMQQIIIRPDGTATKPFRFSIKADESKWVLWNKRRDKSAGTQ